MINNDSILSCLECHISSGIISIINKSYPITQEIVGIKKYYTKHYGDKWYICLYNRNKDFNEINMKKRCSLFWYKNNWKRGKSCCECNALLKWSDNFGIKDEIISHYAKWKNIPKWSSSDFVLFEIVKISNYKES